MLGRSLEANGRRSAATPVRRSAVVRMSFAAAIPEPPLVIELRSDERARSQQVVGVNDVLGELCCAPNTSNTER